MKFLSILALIAPIAFALPAATTTGSVGTPTIVARQACDVQCGSTCYSNDQIAAAQNAAANYVSQDDTAGSSTYPHQYKNFEGFEFPVDGPYYEFPLKTNGVYSGGSPGADRVVINGNGDLAGEITHTGASGNNFVGCQ